MKIVIALFPHFTTLDAIGPYEVLCRLPGAETTFVAASTGTVRSDTGVVGLTADKAFSDVTDADILVVPGGPGTRAMVDDEGLVGWVKAIHQTTTWTTSVCTGALVLGAAGVLDGIEATTHWMAMDLLKQYGATPVSQRVVVQGKVVTAAGVSSGIDMALTLAAKVAGDDIAQGIQLSIEYDPQPPFDSGSVDKAPPHVVETLRQMYGARAAAGS